MSSLRNPGPWRYTWEALSHIPTLRLFLFNRLVKPEIHCKNLGVLLQTHLGKLMILIKWVEFEDPNEGLTEFLLWVPLPNALVDPTLPPSFKAMVDHIEVKLVLVLPIDHSLVVDFESVFDSNEGFVGQIKGSDRSCPLSLDADIKALSSKGEVQFYCKSCSTKLTRKPLSSFVEMPSANWREVADNWFGACCCSFGGASEKLVSAYENTSGCADGACLLDDTSIIICTDDLEGCKFPACRNRNKNHESENRLVDKDNKPVCITEAAQMVSSLTIEERLVENLGSEIETSDTRTFSQDIGLTSNLYFRKCSSTQSFDIVETPVLESLKCESTLEDHNHCCAANSHCFANDGSKRPTESSPSTIKLQTNQKWFLNGSLGSGFMVRPSNISSDIEWIEILCFQCSSLIGSYPSVNAGYVPVDGRVRLFKCCVSTSEVVGGPDDIFRNHSLQRIVVNQLLESAEDELTFRTVVRDLKTKSPVLQLVLLSSKAWWCSSDCRDMEQEIGRDGLKLDLQPAVKVLFQDCRSCTEAESRKIEEWASKNQADEVYMVTGAVIELIKSLKSAQARLPLSCSFLQGLSLSFMER